MDLPAYPAFVFQNRTSAFIMPLRSHIHFETVYSGLILKDLQIISNYPNQLRQVLFGDWAAAFPGGAKLQ
jgi:hypothetical protein